MKNFLIILGLCIILSGSATADSTAHYTPREGDVVTDLPGNVRIVTNPYRPPRGVYIYNGDESLAYRTLVSPHLRQKNLYVPNSVPMRAINQTCSAAGSAAKVNRCIRDAIRAND